jgi:hypothetical protein
MLPWLAKPVARVSLPQESTAKLSRTTPSATVARWLESLVWNKASGAALVYLADVFVSTVAGLGAKLGYSLRMCYAVRNQCCLYSARASVGSDEIVFARSQGAGLFPCLIVIYGIFGLNDNIRELATRLCIIHDNLGKLSLVI